MVFQNTQNRPCSVGSFVVLVSVDGLAWNCAEVRQLLNFDDLANVLLLP